MGDKSAIEWTDATWNPVVGCERISPGCTHCYAKELHDRRHKAALAGKAMPLQYEEPFEVVRTRADRLDMPLRWRAPRRIFVNSMADLFHEDVPDDFIAAVFGVIAAAPRHTFQLLTKRPARALEWFSWVAAQEPDPTTHCHSEALAMDCDEGVIHRRSGMVEGRAWPLPNLWLGVSVENQRFADERIPLLVKTPAAIRFLSCEPMLEAVNIRGHLLDFTSNPGRCAACGHGHGFTRCPNYGSIAKTRTAYQGGQVTCSEFKRSEFGIHLVIAGGESGPRARPMHPEWATSLRDQCDAAAVPFFFKQWGEWAPGECAEFSPKRSERTATLIDCAWHFGSLTPGQSEDLHRDDEPDLYRLGKKRAGRLLDGVEWSQMPEVR